MGGESATDAPADSMESRAVFSPLCLISPVFAGVLTCNLKEFGGGGGWVELGGGTVVDVSVVAGMTWKTDCQITPAGVGILRLQPTNQGRVEPERLLQLQRSGGNCSTRLLPENTPLLPRPSSSLLLSLLFLFLPPSLLSPVQTLGTPAPDCGPFKSSQVVSGSRWRRATVAEGGVSTAASVSALNTKNQSIISFKSRIWPTVRYFPAYIKNNATTTIINNNNNTNNIRQNVHGKKITMTVFCCYFVFKCIVNLWKKG